MDELEKYLLQRGFFDPLVALDDTRASEDAILADDALLAEVASIYKGKERALKALIYERIKPIIKELVMKATPAETMVLRQAMVEVSLIMDDAKKYSDEYDNREKEKKEREANGEATSTIEDNGQQETP